MEAIVLLCAAVVVGFFVMRRMQRGAYVAHGMISAPPQIRAAAQRLGFRAEPNTHSIVSLHSGELCICAMATAFAQMDEHTKTTEALLVRSCEKHLGIDTSTALDAVLVAPWLVEQGGGPTPAFERLTKRLKQLDHGTYFDKLMRVLGDVTAAGTKGMPSAAQADAMGALARIFRTA